MSVVNFFVLTEFVICLKRLIWQRESFSYFLFCFSVLMASAERFLTSFQQSLLLLQQGGNSQNHKLSHCQRGIVHKWFVLSSLIVKEEFCDGHEALLLQ